MVSESQWIYLTIIKFFSVNVAKTQSVSFLCTAGMKNPEKIALSKKMTTQWMIFVIFVILFYDESFRMGGEILNFFSLIKSALDKFFVKNPPTTSHEMETQSELWHDIYMNNGIWLKNDVISLRLPTAITSELSRLVFAESVIRTDEKSPYKAIIDDFSNRLDDEFETALAFGGMMFKPFLSQGKI